MPDKTKKLLAFVAFQTILLLIFYWPFLSGKQVFFYEDSTNFFEPLCNFMGRAFQQGRLPLWNPYSYGGMSQIAISSPSLFYPLNWLFGAMTYSKALAAIMVFSQVVCGVGTFLLIDSLGWGLLPAFLGGSVLCLTGYMFSLSSNYTLVASASWFPLCVHTCRQIFVAPKERVPPSAVALAASAGLMLAAGRPEISGPALIIIALLGAALYLQTPRNENSGDRMLSLVKALLIGVLLSMPVMLPSLEWLPWSRRSQGLPAPETLMFSSNWYDLLDLFTSQPLGDLTLRNSNYRILIQPKNYGPYYGSAFVSSIILALAIIGMSRRGGFLYRATIALCVSSAFISLGSNIPGMDYLVNHVSALSIMRFPSKLLFFTVFCLALLAARGLKQFLEGEAKLIPSSVACVLALAIGFYVHSAEPIVLPFITVPGIDQSYARTAQQLIGSGIVTWSAVGFSACAILWLLRYLHRVAGAVLTVAAAIAALGYHAFSLYQFGAPPAFFDAPSPVAKAIKEYAKKDGAQTDRFVGLFFEKFSIPLGFTSSINLATTIQGYEYGHLALRPFANMDYRLPSAFGFEGSMVGEYFYLMLNSYVKSAQAVIIGAAPGSLPQVRTDVPIARLVQSMATQYVVTQDFRYLADPRLFHQQPQRTKDLTAAEMAELRMRSPVPYLDSNLFQLLNEEKEWNIRIYKVRNPIPRAYLSTSWKTFDSRDALLDGMYNAETSGFDASKQTWIETSTEESIPPAKLNRGGPPALALTASTATMQALPITEAAPEHVSIEAQADQESLVVLADQFYPGWTAKVDEVEVPILRANGFTRAVFVGAGKHTVSFDYKPRSLQSGYLLAAIAFIWSLLLLAANRQPATRKQES